MRTAKTLIRLGGCPGWSESSLGAQPHCWFCHVAAQLIPPGTPAVRSLYSVHVSAYNLLRVFCLFKMKEMFKMVLKNVVPICPCFLMTRHKSDY